MKQYFEDCQIGEKAVSPGRTITEADIVSFAALTGDWNPVHCDAEQMRHHELGERIAHGLLVLSLSGGMLYRMSGYEMLPQQGNIFSGIDQVKFVSPVRIGETVHLNVETIEKSEINERMGLLVMRVRMLNQRNELSMSARFKFAVPRRGDQATEAQGAAQQ